MAEDESLFPSFSLPKVDLGGIQVGGGRELQTGLVARDGDVSFEDTDGDVVTLRKSRGRYVDYFSGGALKIKDGRLERDGRSLLISGIDQSDWKFKFTNGEFKTEIVDQTTPRDPAAVDRAMELVDG